MNQSKEISDLTIEALQASVLDAVVVIDAEGDIVGWNATAADVFGWTAEAAIGKSLGELIIPLKHRDAHREGMRRYSESGVARVVGRRIEITAVNRSGREFPVELSIIAAPPGGAAAFVGFIRDISDRKAAQSRLVLSEESLRLATEAAEVGTWDLDLLTEDLTWSDRTKAMFGISAGTLCTMADFYGGLHEDDRAATSEAFAAALDPSVRAIYDVEYRTVGKEDQRFRWVAAKGKGLFDAEGHCVRAVGTAIDITAKKRAEARGNVMADVTDLLRRGDTTAALEEACALMGRHFAVSRVGYGLLDPVEDIFSYTVCWTDGRVPPLLGEYPAHVFGEQIVAKLSAGETVVVGDLFANAISNEARTLETATEVDTRAILVVPFLRGGRLRTIVYLNAQQPRIWDIDEIAFMEEVAERTRQLIDRAETEAALAAREAEFRTFAQAMPNHVWAASPDGMVDWLNDQTYVYSGTSAPALNGAAWAEIVHPEDRQGAADAWVAALATGQPYETQFRIRRADGAFRWHLVRALPIRDPNGAITRWIGTNTDIEDQKAALDAFAALNATLEDQVRQRTAERNLLATVFESTDAFIHVVDLDYRWLAINKAGAEEFAQVFGPYPKVGDRMLDLLEDQPNQKAAAETVWSRALAGEEFTAVSEFGEADRVRNTYEMKFNNLYDDDGQRIGAYQVVTNINERVAAQQQLINTQEALRQAQKMEAVGQLTGGIAHDFNNMLAVVMGSLDLLNRRIGIQDPRARHYVQAASDAAKRAANLTHRLLAFSRQQALQPEVLDPNRLVASMSELLRHSIGADIRLETVLAGGIWRIEADPNQLENVILNLSVNARDAMPGGGRLTIETQNAHLDERYVSNEAGMSVGQYVMIAITDTGTGMSQEVVAKAFDPFFTTKEVGKGTGLGLSQVYGFVKQSGGHVRIYSEIGEGTTIKIYLPKAGEGALATEVDAHVQALTGDEREVILVVDDEPAVRQFSVDALSELGYRVLEAESGVAALQLLRLHADVVLLFTDIVMPEMNGRKLADEALVLRPGLRVLYTTGYTRNAVVHNGVVDKGVALIGKPFTIDELAAKVRALLDS